MDLARSLGRLGSDIDGPGPAFNFAGGQIGLQAQQFKARFDQAVQARFRQPFHFQIFFCFRFRQLRDFRFHFGRNHNYLRVFLSRELLHGFYMGIAAEVSRLFFRHVADKNNGLPGQQMQIVQHSLFFFRKFHTACRDNILQPLFDPFQQRLFRRCFFIVSLQQLLHFFHPVGNRINIRQAQLRVNDLDIPYRVYAAFHMGHILVLKAADHFRNGIRVADMAQELVAQTFAFRCPFYQTGNVNKVHNGRRNFFRIKHFGQHVQPFIRHGNHALVRLNGAERIIGRLCPGFCNRIKQRALPYIRKPYDTYVQICTHGSLSFMSLRLSDYRIFPIIHDILLYHKPMKLAKMKHPASPSVKRVNRV